jgi:hypothetical protein
VAERSLAVCQFRSTTLKSCVDLAVPTKAISFRRARVRLGTTRLSSLSVIMVSFRACFIVVVISAIDCVSCECDRYQRLVATCWRQGSGIEQTLVSHGSAVACRRYSLDHLSDEDIARYLMQRMWAGRFQMPWEWRQVLRRQ